MIGAVRGKDKLVVNIDGEQVVMVKAPVRGDNNGDSLYVPLTETQLAGGTRSSAQTPEPGSESSFASILEKIRHNVSRDFGPGLQALRHVGLDAGVNIGHQCIWLVMHHAWQTLKKEGIPLSDPRIDEAIKTAVNSAISVAEEWDNQEPFNARSVAVFQALRGHISNVKPHKPLQLLHSEEFSGTPFGKIAPANRAFMCVDPCKITALEEKSGAIPGPQENTPASRNPLIALLFDSEAHFLGNMAEGWKLVMNSLKDSTPQLNSGFIGLLHETAAAATPSAGKAGVAANFMLIPGRNLSPAGHQETSQFIEALRRDHGIDISFDVVRTESARNIYGIKRGEVPAETVHKLMNNWIDEYNVASASADSLPAAEKSDAKVLAAIDLCQKLERFHVFKDGNCRVFAMLLLNYLLAKEGEPLTALDNPNKLDGFSRMEMLQLVREGQAQVKALEQQA